MTGEPSGETEVTRLADKLSEVTGKQLTVERLKKQPGSSTKKERRSRNFPNCAPMIPHRSPDSMPSSSIESPSTMTLSASPPSSTEEPATSWTGGSNQALALPRRARQGSSYPGHRWPYRTGSSTTLSRAAAVSLSAKRPAFGERNFKNLLPDFSSVKEAVEKMADRSMTVNCACFTPALTAPPCVPQTLRRTAEPAIRRLLPGTNFLPPPYSHNSDYR